MVLIPTTVTASVRLVCLSEATMCHKCWSTPCICEPRPIGVWSDREPFDLGAAMRQIQALEESLVVAEAERYCMEAVEQ